MAKKKTVRRCPSCGIDFDDPHMTICKYCGSVTKEVVAPTRSPASENTIEKNETPERPLGYTQTEGGNAKKIHANTKN